MKKNFLCLSIDAETNGLWGQAFSIGATLTLGSDILATFVARCPIEEKTDSWVLENVLPKMEAIPETHESYESMLKSFIDFYMEKKQGAQVIVHMGLPVESRLFQDAHKMGILGDWDAPYPLVDIAALPEISTSVDSYNKKSGIEVPDFGGTHNPLYDAMAAALAYNHWMNNH